MALRVAGRMLQGFLALGLEKTSAGLGSVIIDSQPITVAILAALFLGETLSAVGIGGLAIGVVGLLLLVRARATRSLARRPLLLHALLRAPSDMVRGGRRRGESHQQREGRRVTHTVVVATHTHTRTHTSTRPARPARPAQLKGTPGA
jgi:hypothetical protein